MRYLKITAVAAAIAFSGSSVAETYNIDPSHSFIEFKINHAGFSTLVGSFDELSGSFDFDVDKPELNAASVTVNPASVDTNFSERDGHIKGERHLDTDKFDTASFKSISYAGTAKEGTLTGDLTIHGVSKSVDVPIKMIGMGEDPWSKKMRAGFEGAVEITRADFGLEAPLGPKAATVEIGIFLEGILAK